MDVLGGAKLLTELLTDLSDAPPAAPKPAPRDGVLPLFLWVDVEPADADADPA